MNNGAFGENFPYSNFHDLNMDWIIKIAKDFLDQYTHIQQVITDGETSLQNLTTEGLQQLQDKADNLETLLQEWYNTHSTDIANQLTIALTELSTALTQSLNTFNNQANTKLELVLASIPDDYTELADKVDYLGAYNEQQNKTENKYVNSSGVVANSETTDLVLIENPYIGMAIDYTGTTDWSPIWGYNTGADPVPLLPSNDRLALTHYKFIVKDSYEGIRLWGYKGSELQTGDPSFNVCIDGANYQASVEYMERNEEQATPTANRYLTNAGVIATGSIGGSTLLTLTNIPTHTRIKYTGYTWWTPIFGYYSDGTAIPLVPSTKEKFWKDIIIEITDPKIETVRAWYMTSEGTQTFNEHYMCYTDDCINYSDREITLTVGGGNAKFSCIEDAVDYAKTNYDVSVLPVTVFVRRGIYNLSYVADRLDVISKGANKISIIGEDRDHCIIKLTNTTSKMNCIMGIGGDCTIANLSFFAYFEDDGETGEQRRTYCLHNDYGYNYSYDTPYRTVVENCYFYDEGMRPLGAGLWQNQTQVYRNCVFEWKGDRWTNDGAISIHAPTDSNANTCAVEIINCTAYNHGSGYALVLDDTQYMSFSDIDTTIQRLIGYTNGSTDTNVSIATHKLTPICALNNISSLNY